MEPRRSSSVHSSKSESPRYSSHVARGLFTAPARKYLWEVAPPSLSEPPFMVRKTMADAPSCVPAGEGGGE